MDHNSIRDVMRLKNCTKTPVNADRTPGQLFKYGTDQSYVILVTILVSLVGCATASWSPYMRGLTAYQKGECQEAIRHFEDAIRIEPTSALIQSGLNSAKNCLAEQIVAEADQLPPGDLNGKLQKLKQATSLAPENPKVVQKFKETESLIGSVRDQAAKVVRLTDDGTYSEAQSVTENIKQYNLMEVKNAVTMLENSVEANERANRELSPATLLNFYREMSETQKRPLGKKSRGLVLEKLEWARPQMIQALSSRIESDSKITTSSTKLAQFYRDLLLGSPTDFPSLEIAVGRLNFAPISVGIYSTILGPANRVRSTLEGAGLSKNAVTLVSLPVKASRADFEKLGLVLLISA